MAEWPFSQAADPLVVAHRGASLERPENTCAAFARAIEVGADAVELDVRLTADGVPVVFHDEDLDRTTDGTGPVHLRTAAEVAELRSGGEPVPTLAEALTVCSGRVAVDVELKRPPPAPGAVEALIEATAGALASFEGSPIVTSFDRTLLERWREAVPGVAAGLLVGPTTAPQDAFGAAVDLGCAWVLPFTSAVAAAGATFVGSVHAAGLRLGVWIEDDPARAEALAAIGVDAIATNDPAALVAALAARPAARR